MLSLGFRLAYMLRFETGLSFFQLNVAPSTTFYKNLVFFIIPLWLLVFYLAGLYNRQSLLGGTREYDLVFRATAVGFLLVVVAGFLDPDFIIARGFLLTAWGFSFLLTAIGRFLLRRLVYNLRTIGFFLTPAVIIGANAEGRSLAEQLLGWRTSGLAVVGFIDEKSEVTQPINRFPPVLGSLEKLDQIITEYQVEELIIATSAISRDGLLSIFKHYGFNSQVNLRLSSGLYEIITTGLTVKEFAYVPLIEVNKVRLTGTEKMFKLILDYGMALPLVILIMPFLLLIAVIILIDSPGPIIHRRRVMGINGRQFDAFKFRTMYANADEILVKYPELQAELIKNQKIKNDPRITRVGKFLRKASLDELPQLFNVLQHEMSLVGPRMITPEEVKVYNQWGMNLLTVQPGITGLWQVSGRSDVSYEERVRLDMHYIRNWSIWLDLQLIWQTIPAVLKGKGAY
jgi:exopolysaccharide biosynthesis polyprenyl glycosylphosphotransferase